MLNKNKAEHKFSILHNSKGYFLWCNVLSEKIPDIFLRYL